MASYSDWRAFNNELRQSLKLRDEEKKLYNSFKELNTGGWSITSSSSIPLSSNFGSVSISSPAPVSSSSASPVSSPVSSTSAVSSAASSSSPVSSASPVSSVPSPASTSSAMPSATIRDLPELALNNPAELRDVIEKIVGTDKIAKKAVSTSGSVSAGGILSYRNLTLEFVNSNTALNGVALRVKQGFNEVMIVEPVTDGLMALLFMNDKTSEADFNRMWSKVSESDKFSFIKINRLAAALTKDKAGDFLKAIYRKLDSNLQEIFATHHETKGASRDKIFINPAGKVLSKKDLKKLDDLKLDRSGNIVGAGIRSKSKTRKNQKAQSSKHDKTDRLTLLLGSIAAGNNNKKQIEEALSLLSKA